MGKGADVGDGNKTARKRAVGTREHILACLAEVGELFDQNGMASTQLAAAVGYPGSSVAFAQLLSGMERAGLIDREVRGKRTYRISLGRAQAVGLARLGRPGAPGRSGPASVAAGLIGTAGIAGAAGVAGMAGASGVAGEDAEFDYDELARRLLVQVVRRLAATEPEPGPLDPAALRETVTGLEHELASAWSKHGKLAEENVRLREQLTAAQRSLALAREQVRRLPVTSDLDSDEVGLLQRLLSGSPEGADGSQDVPV
ncbi:MAG: hypothetical protein ACRDPY_11755 [Streptosporangiaceae bacterium]